MGRNSGIHPIANCSSPETLTEQMNDCIRLVPPACQALLKEHSEHSSGGYFPKRGVAWELIVVTIGGGQSPENTDSPSQSHCDFGADLSPCTVTALYLLITLSPGSVLRSEPEYFASHKVRSFQCSP